jgi:hypothetical protein
LPLVAIWFGSLLSFRLTIFIREFMALSLDLMMTLSKESATGCKATNRVANHCCFASRKVKNDGIVGSGAAVTTESAGI